MNGICLIAGLLVAPFGDDVTLRWMHSIQKTVWEEDYHREQEGLLLIAARVRGTGAGMEPPPDAVLRDGAWHYRPDLPALPRVLLRHSPHVPPYELCSENRCRPVTAWLPGLPADAVIELAPCRPAPATSSTTVSPDEARLQALIVATEQAKGANHPDVADTDADPGEHARPSGIRPSILLGPIRLGGGGRVSNARKKA